VDTDEYELMNCDVIVMSLQCRRKTATRTGAVQCRTTWGVTAASQYESLRHGCHDDLLSASSRDNASTRSNCIASQLPQLSARLVSFCNCRCDRCLCCTLYTVVRKDVQIERTLSVIRW